MPAQNRIIGEAYLFDIDNVTTLVDRLKNATLDISLDSADNTAIKDFWTYSKVISATCTISATEAVEEGTANWLMEKALISGGVNPTTGVPSGAKTPIDVAFCPAHGQKVIRGKFYITSASYNWVREGHEVSITMQNYGAITIS